MKKNTPPVSKASDKTACKAAEKTACKATSASHELTPVQKREIIAILTVGCPRRTAARYVGCSVRDIVWNAKHDTTFERQINRAEVNLEIEMMKALYNAGQQEKNWRASSWILERRLPEDFAKQKTDVINPAQFRETFSRITEIICQSFPTEKSRQEVLKRLAAALDNTNPDWRK